MDAWVDGRMDGWMSWWEDGYRCIHGWRNGCMNRWGNVWHGRRMSG